jgi:hypothetical protein
MMRTLLLLIHRGFPHFGITYDFLPQLWGIEAISELYGPVNRAIEPVLERRAADLSANRQIES